MDWPTVTAVLGAGVGWRVYLDSWRDVWRGYWAGPVWRVVVWIARIVGGR